MSQLTQIKTGAAQGTAIIEAESAKIGEALNNLLTVISSSVQTVWSLPTAVLLDTLNSDIPRFGAMLSHVAETAEFANAKQDILALVNPLTNAPLYSTRAPLARPRTDIVLDLKSAEKPEGTNQWILLPPVEEVASDQ